MVSTLLFPCKSSLDFYKNSEYKSILSQQKMTFQASNSKGRNFLDLLGDNLNPIKPLSFKDNLQLLQFGHSNSLCARASRAITNHTPIGEYRLRFFPRESFICPCGLYPIETRQHILHECYRFNNYWNPRRDTLSHFSLFLQFNPSAFAFPQSLIFYVTDCITLLFQTLYSFYLCLVLFLLCFFVIHLFLSSCCICLNICSYEVATTICPYTPCNKLLI